MNHKQKTKLARKMMSRHERKQKTSPFDTKAWIARKTAIEMRVDRKIAKSKELAKKRKNNSLVVDIQANEIHSSK